MITTPVLAMEGNSSVDFTLHLGLPGQGAGPDEAHFIPHSLRQEIVDTINARLLVSAEKKADWKPPL